MKFFRLITIVGSFAALTASSLTHTNSAALADDKAAAKPAEQADKKGEDTAQTPAASTATSTAASPTASAAQTRPVNSKALPFIKEGYTYLSKGANAKAIKALRKAILIDKDCISGRRYLAYAMVREGDYKDALVELQKVSKLVQPNAFDFYLFGEAYYGANGIKQAHDCYSEALHQNGTYDAARVGLVKTYAKENKFDDAFNTLQEGISQAKDETVKRYYASLSKAVTEAQSFHRAQSGGVLNPTALPDAQVGNESVKSEPVLIK
jgi:tetratricopeptide (TPR) repeat protein